MNKVRCLGITQKNSRCKKSCYGTDIYCFMHKVQQQNQEELKCKTKKTKPKLKRCKYNYCITKSPDDFCEKHKNLLNKLEKPEDCAICYEKLGDDDYPLSPCGHWIHRSCQIKFNNTCAMCRTPLELSNSEQKLIQIKKDNENQSIDNFLSNLNNYSISYLEEMVRRLRETMLNNLNENLTRAFLYVIEIISSHIELVREQEVNNQEVNNQEVNNQEVNNQEVSN
jgi:hypothetical protein